MASGLTQLAIKEISQPCSPFGQGPTYLLEEEVLIDFVLKTLGQEPTFRHRLLQSFQDLIEDQGLKFLTGLLQGGLLVFLFKGLDLSKVTEIFRPTSDLHIFFLGSLMD